MNITRRKFFFFGLAAGVGLLLPNKKLELNKNELNMYYAVMHPAQKKFYDELLDGSTLYGIPYHQSNAGMGTWLGFDRTKVPQMKPKLYSGGR